jgi:uncharacterized membrane protein YkvA (DUF1232 family)
VSRLAAFFMGLGRRASEIGRKVRRELYTLYLAYRDPRTPWYARVVAAAVLAYALSPIDLIPDFIPVLGYLDDLILIPLGVALALRLIPAEVMEDCRRQARKTLEANEVHTWPAVLAVVLIWAAVLALVGWRLARTWRNP